MHLNSFDSTVSGINAPFKQLFIPSVIQSGSDSQASKQVAFPFPKKEDVVSQPVNVETNDKASALTGPKLAKMALM